MTITQEITLFVVTLVIFSLIDLMWVGFVAEKRYKKALKKFMTKEFKLPRIALYYVIYVLGLLVMVLVPAVNADSLGVAVFRGAAFGFFTYAFHNLANWSSIERWPTRVTFEDIAWGSFLGFASSTLAYNFYISVF